MPQPNALNVPSPIIDDSPDVPRDVLALVNAISPMLTPNFASTTARDVAYATVPFKQCTVGEVFYQRRGSGWEAMLTGQVAQIAVDGSTNVNDQQWTLMGGMSTVFAVGSDLTPVATAVRVQPGIYLVTGQVEWASGGSGNRFAGIGFNSLNVKRWATAPPSTGIRSRASVSDYLQATLPNTELCLYAAHTAGSTQVAAYRSLSVQRVA